MLIWNFLFFFEATVVKTFNKDKEISPKKVFRNPEWNGKLNIIQPLFFPGSSSWEKKFRVSKNYLGRLWRISLCICWMSLQRQPQNKKKNSNQIFYYARCITPKRVTTWRSPTPRHCIYGKHSLFRNVATVASRWQHCVRFDRPEIWTSDLPLQRRTCYHSTN